MLQILNHTVSEPDSDNDSRVEGTIRFQNNSDNEQELITVSLRVLNQKGFLLSSSFEEYDEHIGPGEEWETEFSSSYFKNYTIESGATLQADAVGSSCTYKDLGCHPIPSNGIAGHGGVIDLGGGFFLQGLAIIAGEPDDDGEINVEIKALLRNTSASYSPRVKIEARVLGSSGREVEDCSNYGDTILPYENKMISASACSKKSRLNGASMEAKISLFVVSQRSQSATA